MYIMSPSIEPCGTRNPFMASSLSIDSGALHRAIIEQASEAVIFVDREGIIALWNRGAETIFGYSAAEAQGQNLNLIIPERFRPAHDAGFSRAVTTGATRTEGRVLTTRAQNKLGARLYVDLSFGLVKDDSGTVAGAFAIGRDVTARHLEQAAFRAGSQTPTG